MIKENVKRLLAEIPPHVMLVVAAKQRRPEEILEAVEAGVRAIGENYIQEAEAAHAAIGTKVAWHFIGHLQRNKVKRAVPLFDMIETVDSVRLAAEINKVCAREGKTMPVLIEVNSGREPQKAGVDPDDAEALLHEIAGMSHLRVKGLMTMGPRVGNPEEARPYFRTTKGLYDGLKALRLPEVEMNVLSMGMTNSYRVAIEEGATMVRIGTKIFGKRVAE